MRLVFEGDIPAMPRLGPRLLIAVLALLLSLPAAAVARPAATEVRIAPAEQVTEIAIAFTGAPPLGPRS